MDWRSVRCSSDLLCAGVVDQTLFPYEYVCVVPRSYLPAGRLTMNRFKAARHVLVDGRHLGHIHEDVEKLLRKIVGPSNITVMAESFLLSAHKIGRASCRERVCQYV